MSTVSLYKLGYKQNRRLFETEQIFKRILPEMDYLQSVLTYDTYFKVGFLASVITGYCLYKALMSRISCKSRVTTNYNVVCPDTKTNCKLVLVVRTDLKMGKGKIIAQCAHAAVEAYKSALKHPSILRNWEHSGQMKITVKVNNEDELMEIARKARVVGLLVKIIQDAGHTQVAPGSRTVCGVGPGPVELINEVTGHLKLY